MQYLLILLMGVHAAAAKAEDNNNRELKEFFRGSFETIRWAMERSTFSGEETFSGMKDRNPDKSALWLLSDIKIRIRHKAGFDIPGLGSMRLVPEIELDWARRQPSG